MYRALHDHDEVGERRRQATHPAAKKPELLATGPNEVWSWDIELEVAGSCQMDLVLPVPHLCSWAGLTAKYRQSDTTVRRGHVTKQGSKLVRWAAVEAVARLRPGTKQYDDWKRIASRRGKLIGRVAEARKLLTLVFYGLRDGTIRCLGPRKEAA